MRAFDARAVLIAAALSAASTQFYNDAHPDNPHRDAEAELRDDMLDEAAREFVLALDVEAAK